MSTTLISLEEAQRRILEPLRPLGAERLPLEQASGRVLAEDVVAVRDTPPEANSAMDGYALRWADVQSVVTGAGPVTLNVVHEIPAGGRPGPALQPGQAARIFTGAPVPDGEDILVVMQESTVGDVGKDGEGPRRVVIEACGDGVGDNVRPAGEDVAFGSVVGRKGQVLGAGLIGLIAGQGLGRVSVRRRPVVSIISTGNEVHEPGDALPAGHIYSSNTFALAALIREAGGEPRILGIARDDLASLRSVFGGIEGSDAVVSIGGVSVGEYDLVRTVLDELGGEQHFWKVAMRPGKPNACGTLAGIPYFGLPGNPVSSFVSFLQYVRPALLRMQGAAELFLPTRSAVIDHPLRSRRRFLFLYRGQLRWDHEGETVTTTTTTAATTPPTSGCYRVRTTGPQGSGILRSIADANCLVAVPEGVDQVAAGDTVRVQLLPTGRAAQAAPGLRATTAEVEEKR